MANRNRNGTELLHEWEKISVWCINHDEPVPMEITQNTESFKTPFYACQKRPRDHSEGDVCFNRLNLDDYQGIVLKLFEIISEDPFSDLTNKTFDYKGARQKIMIRIIKYTDAEIHLGILNKTVLR